MLELAAAHVGSGNWSSAADLYQQILERQPQCIDAHYGLAQLWYQLGRWSDAAASYLRLLEILPDVPELLNGLGNCLRCDMKLDAAAEAYRRAIELRPDYAIAHSNLGETWLLLGRYVAALDQQRRAIELDPHRAEFHNSLGIALKELGRLDEAVSAYHRALELQPNYATPYTNLGLALLDLARGDESLACFRRALELNPRNRTAHSGLLFARIFHPGNDPRVVCAEQREWQVRHVAPLAPSILPHDNNRRNDRRLRVGYVSPYFREHCQSLFTVPLLSSHDHGQVEVFCYSDVQRSDAVTDRLRGYADTWRETQRLSDEQLSQTIREDSVDILVDLTMHMAHNRALVFARKPAPVQVCWLAYPGSTGLAAMDYRISDPFLDPLGMHDHLYSEQTVRLPDSFWCYDPLDYAATVNELPAATAGHITFGCLNNFCKVNEIVLRLWARILAEVKSSRLMILVGQGSHREWARRTLMDNGVAAERITFVERQTRARYLNYYQEIDVALDTVPSNGHTTSLDALWMGVPVVTLVGDTVSGRAGLCQLTNLKLTELIASSADEYVTVAAGLAHDRQRLAALRRELRDRLQHSPLMDASRFAHNVEAAYREMWRRWCEKPGG